MTNSDQKNNPEFNLPQDEVPKEEGGEWELLTQKVLNWWEEKDLSSQWNQLTKPILLIAILLVSILILKIYGNFLDGIAQVPLAPRLFELIGIVWFISFSAKNLVRKDARKELQSDLIGRWQTFIGDRSKAN